VSHICDTRSCVTLVSHLCHACHACVTPVSHLRHTRVTLVSHLYYTCIAHVPTSILISAYLTSYLFPHHPHAGITLCTISYAAQSCPGRTQILIHRTSPDVTLQVFMMLYMSAATAGLLLTKIAARECLTLSTRSRR
jgi:hypothetical protein